MNFRNINLRTFTLIAVSIFILVSSNAVFASGDCQRVRGFERGALNPDGSGARGRVSQAGRFNGTTEVVLTNIPAPTADPFVYFFTDDLSLTTIDGVLRTHNATMQDIVNGVATAIARIDPDTSEGAFAGATGVLYINAKLTDSMGSFQAEIIGEVCYAD